MSRNQLKNQSCITIALGWILVFSAVEHSGAQQLPKGINLGSTSFLDGGPPAGPGLYYQQYAQYYHSNSFLDANGNVSGFLDYNRFDAWASVNQFIYMSEIETPIGGKWGLDFILPFIDYSVDSGSSPITSAGAGFGDLHASFLIQFDLVMGDQGPKFVHRLEIQSILPTGSYDSNFALNPGDNVFALDPYWAGTYWITPDWTITWGIHYLWSAENTDPTLPGASTTQAGSATHINFSSSVAIIPNKFRLGVNGYFLKQFDDSKINGVNVPDSREQVLGIGPGVMWSFNQEQHLFVNAYFETAVKNRPKGSLFVLHYTHHF